MPQSVSLPFPVLTTGRLLLRQLSEQDEQAISALRSDHVVNAYLPRPPKTSIAEARTFILKVNEDIRQHKSFYWAICLIDNRCLIGTICLWNLSADGKTAEVGYELGAAYHGRGLMNEALKTIIHYSFYTFGFTTLEAFTHRDNVRSRGLLEKNSFRLHPDRTDEENPHNIIYTRSV